MRQEFRPLTQEELLAEAAQTEIENTASVQVSLHSSQSHAHPRSCPSTDHHARMAVQLPVQLRYVPVMRAIQQGPLMM